MSVQADSLSWMRRNSIAAGCDTIGTAARLTADETIFSQSAISSGIRHFGLSDDATETLERGICGICLHVRRHGGLAMMEKREFHDLASIFPMLAGDEAKALAHDIFEHGLREPIILLEGKILDGRNRYIACLDAGIELRFADYRGDNPAAYVVSLNLKRRHLNESQRAMVAAKLDEFAARLQPACANWRYLGRRGCRPAQCRQALCRARQDNSSRTVPEIVKAVEKGNVRVSAAAPFAKQPREKQAKQIRNANTPADAVKTHCRDLSTSSGKPNRSGR